MYMYVVFVITCICLHYLIKKIYMTYIAQEVYSIITMFQTHVTLQGSQGLFGLTYLVTVSVWGMLKL